MIDLIKLSEKSHIVKYHPTDELLHWIDNNFNELFESHPVYPDNEKSKILQYNKDDNNPQWYDLETHRWYQSYLKTPEFSNQYKKSYMFSSSDKNEIIKELPEQMKYLFDYAKTLDSNYNQVVTNWYERENDFIPAHSDWIDGMIENYNIGTLSLYGKNDKLRNFKITNKETGQTYTFKLGNGEFIMMCGDFQNEFRHEVEKISDDNIISRRIGITFRQYQ